MLKISEILKRLDTTNIPRLDAELLLAHALRRDRVFILSHPQFRLSLFSFFIFHFYLLQRRRGIPLAYITHHKEFYGLDFFVNKHTLVPRPETELMVENVIEKIQKLGNSEITLIDVGTGSGCVPIAIVKNLAQHRRGEVSSPSSTGDVLSQGGETPPLRTYATDISKKALSVARQNARAHNVPITFLHGDLLEPIMREGVYPRRPNRDFAEAQQYAPTVIVTANLPYVTAEQFASEPSIQHEPYNALVAKNNGLALYEQLLNQIQSHLPATSYKLQAFLEIDPSQSTLIRDLIKNYLPTATCEIKKDLAGHDRLAVVHLQK